MVPPIRHSAEAGRLALHLEASFCFPPKTCLIDDRHLPDGRVGRLALLCIDDSKVPATESFPARGPPLEKAPSSISEFARSVLCFDGGQPVLPRVRQATFRRRRADRRALSKWEVVPCNAFVDGVGIER
ncbi:hypothetical protein JCM19992_08430 [Thermostilla marina]